MRIFARILLSTLAVLATLTGTNAMAIEEPAFSVLRQDGDIEIREYTPYLVAETLIAGADDRNAAANEGFRRLFRYISGDNSAAGKIAMTAPVLQSQERANNGEKIAMTAPVQQMQTEAGWRVGFVLPAEYTLETAPVPDDERIQVRQAAPRQMAVMRFSGRWSESNYTRHRDELLAFLARENIETDGNVLYAAYNAPFSLPLMRRNEVMVEIRKSP